MASASGWIGISSIASSIGPAAVASSAAAC
jgi:hypothetical protein